MTDPKRVTDTWRELRPQLGEFLNRLDNCMVECGSNAEAYKKGYDLGYDRGSKKPVECEFCPERDWWQHTHGERAAELVRGYSLLKPENQMLVLSLVEQLSRMEQTINNAEAMLLR